MFLTDKAKTLYQDLKALAHELVRERPSEQQTAEQYFDAVRRTFELSTGYLGYSVDWHPMKFDISPQYITLPKSRRINNFLQNLRTARSNLIGIVSSDQSSKPLYVCVFTLKNTFFVHTYGSKCVDILSRRIISFSKSTDDALDNQIQKIGQDIGGVENPIAFGANVKALAAQSNFILHLAQDPDRATKAMIQAIAGVIRPPFEKDGTAPTPIL